MTEPILRILPSTSPKGVKINITIEAEDSAGLLGLLVELLQGRVASAQTPAPAVAPVTPVRLGCPFPLPRKARHVITVDGTPREVPAAVARVVGRIAKGERELRLRPEVIDKLRLELPELLAGLHRDHDRKVIGNAAPYRVAPFVTVTATDQGAVAEPETPFIQTPERISAKMPTEVIIDGEPRTVPACVAAILREIELGVREVCIRPEALAKFERHVPEVTLKRDSGRKVSSNRAWYFVEIE